MSTSYCFKMHIVFWARGQLFVAARLSREELRIIARPVIKDNSVRLVKVFSQFLSAEVVQLVDVSFGKRVKVHWYFISYD